VLELANAHRHALDDPNGACRLLDRATTGGDCLRIVHAMASHAESDPAHRPSVFACVAHAERLAASAASSLAHFYKRDLRPFSAATSVGRGNINGLPQRVQQGVRNVVRLPSRGGGEVPIVIRPMTLTDVTWWAEHVQPSIAQTTRPDRDWNWLRIAGPHLGGSSRVGRQRFSAITMGVQHGETLVTCGMLLIITHASHLPEQRKRSVYVWYFADAPRDRLEQLLPPELTPRPIASALLDVALCESFNRRWAGRLDLYADERGGDGLLAFYRGRGMTSLDARIAPPRRLAQIGETPNDGRFFFHTTTSAIAASRLFDTMR
jgi:hypothetical protein